MPDDMQKRNTAIQIFAKRRVACCLLAIMMTTALAFTLVSCAGGSTTTATTTGESQSQSNATTAAPSATSVSSATSGETTAASTAIPAMSPGDLAVTINSKSYGMLDEAKPLTEALGEPVRYSEAPSCLYEGFDKTYEYADLTLYTITTQGVDRIDGVDLTSDKWQTSRGIKVGSSQTDVFKAYGAPFSEDGDLVYITDESMGGTSPRITFVMDGETVSAISIYSGSNATGG
jgi:hypothetical protein